MRYVRKLPVLGLATLLLVALVVPGALAVQPVVPTDMGVPAYSYTQQLSAGARIAGTESELAAANTVAGWFEEAGYEPEFQPFRFGDKGAFDSQNVIAYSAAAQGSSAQTPLVIVGAHYDCVAAAKGADDNASGVAAMLEVAARLKDHKLPYDVAFIAFGAEEVGLKGSNYYVSQMSDQDMARTIAMINFDSLIVGDYCYIHSGLNHETWVQDDMLEIIDDLDLPIVTHPSPKYPAGVTPNEFSDYSAFNKAGIPIVAFEATNWEIANLDGYAQLDPTQFDDPEYADLWEIWHTEYDYLEFIDGLLGERPEQHLKAYTTLVYVFLRDLRP